MFVLPALAEKYESWQRCHNCPGCESNKEQKKTLVRSEGWLTPAECLEIALPDELKKIKLAHLGRQREAIRLVE
jgi:hypothetical protein